MTGPRCDGSARGARSRAGAAALGLATALVLACTGEAMAFPVLDAPEVVPGSLDVASTSVVLDYDDDGFLDIAALNYGRTVTLRLGTATGFAAAQTLELGGGNDTPGLVAADLTGDGYDDLVAIGGQVISLVVIRGRVDGALVAPAPGDVHALAAPELGSGALTSLDVGDLDADGDLDVAAAVGAQTDTGTPANTAETGQVRILVNAGDGTLAASATTLAVNAPRDVMLVALSGDGDPDLVVAQANREASTTVKVFPGGSGRRRSALPTYAPAGAPATELDWGDFNGDARPDLVVAHAAVNNHAQQPASILPGAPAPASFGAPISVAAADGTHVIAADLDRDGRDDLYVSDGRLASGDSDNPIFVRGLGGLQFGAREQSPVEDDPRYESRPQIADIDGDGKLDIVTTGWDGLPPDEIFIRYGVGPQLVPLPADGIDFGYVALGARLPPQPVVVHEHRARHRDRDSHVRARATSATSRSARTPAAAQRSASARAAPWASASRRRRWATASPPSSCSPRTPISSTRLASSGPPRSHRPPPAIAPPPPPPPPASHGRAAAGRTQLRGLEAEGRPVDQARAPAPRRAIHADLPECRPRPLDAAAALGQPGAPHRRRARDAHAHAGRHRPRGRQAHASGGAARHPPPRGQDHPAHLVHPGGEDTRDRDEHHGAIARLSRALG